MPEIDEDILRQLMLRSTDDLFAPPAAAAEAIRRQRRLRVRKRVLSAAGTAAAAGLAAGVLASASGKGAPGGVDPRQSRATGSAAPPMRLTAAQQALFSLSAAAAAKTPRPGGRYVVLKEQTTTIESGAGVKVSYIGGKTSVIDTVTGGGVTYQDIVVSGAAGTPAPPAVLNAAPGNSPTIARLDAMPTDPAKLRAALLSQVEQQLKQAQQQMKQQLKKLGAEGKQMIADPATGATLESAWDNPSGEFDEDLYQSITYTNTIPSDPYRG